MTFQNYETSNANGQPVDLYEFRLGNTSYRYCTADVDLPVAGEPDEVWKALAILDDGVSQGGSDQNDLLIRIQSDAEAAQIFRNGRPSGKLWLTVRRMHLGDPDEEIAVRWIGSVTNAIQEDDATTAMNCRSIAGSYDRNGLRLFWSRMCPHVLYGVGCNIDKDDHAYQHVLATVSGVGFTVTNYAAPAEGSFAGGFLEYTRGDGSFERLGIESHNGNDFRTLGAASGLAVGMAVTLFPGCKRNTTNCKLFGNLANYGGFPHMPGKSPFDGSPVF